MTISELPGRSEEDVLHEHAFGGNGGGGARNGRIGQIEQGILHVPGRHSAVVLPTSAQQQRWFVHADSVRWVRNEPIRRRCESGEGGCFAAQLRVHVLEWCVREVRIAKDVHQ